MIPSAVIKIDPVISVDPPTMLTKEQILDAAEAVLRKYGPRKTTVVDVARALGVSHGTVYRHFATKAALHEAITSRWVERVTAPLDDIANKSTSPGARLREWFETLMEIKQRKVHDDPEMFESYSLLAQKVPDHIVFSHLAVMISQISRILQDGVDESAFDVADCDATARSLFDATLRYHHPLHVKEWSSTQIKEEFDALFTLLERAIEKRQ